LAGLAAGAFATAALVALGRSRTESLGIQSIGRAIALVALGAGLVLLLVDAEAGIKNPARFFYLLTNFNSVMTWGVAILSGFSLVIVVTLVLSLTRRLTPRWLDVVGMLLALSTAAYTGVLLGVVKTYPIWNTALLPVLFLVSALSAGAAATGLGTALFARRDLGLLHPFKRLHVVLPVVEGLLVAALLFVTASSNPAALQSAERMISGDLSMAFWLGLVVVGLCVPLVLELLSLRRRNGEAALSAAGSAGTLVGGIVLRYLVVFSAVPLVFVS
jgi:formate-dependent nitrite reductase membrane component NrfD